MSLVCSRNAWQGVAAFRGRRELRLLLPRCNHGGDNRAMPKASHSEDVRSATPTAARSPFSPGSMVVVTLGNPRDKFWGMILALAAEGLSMSGIELACFEDLAAMVKEGEPFSSAVVFFPMHRIERVELDLPDGSLPSLSQRFLAKTGLEPSDLLGSSVRDGNASSGAHPGARGAAAQPEGEPA